MMAKRTTAACLKRSCAQQRGLRNCLKHAFTCQIPQLYTDQVPRRSTHKPLSYRRDGQTDRQTDGQTSFQLYIVDAMITELKAELPTYIAKTADVSTDMDPLEWWTLNCSELLSWSTAAKKALLL